MPPAGCRLQAALGGEGPSPMRLHLTSSHSPTRLPERTRPLSRVRLPMELSRKWKLVQDQGPGWEGGRLHGSAPSGYGGPG